MGIRSKLFMLLLLPIAALAIVSIAGLRDQRAESDTNDRAQRLAETLVTADDLAQRVGDERMGLARGDSRDAIARLTEATNESLQVLQSRGGVLRNLAEEVEATLAPQRGQIGPEALRAYHAALSEISQMIEAQPLDGFSADAVISARGVHDARIALNNQEHAWFEFFALDSVASNDISRVASSFADADRTRRGATSTLLTNGRFPYGRASASPTTRSLGDQAARANEDLIKATPDEISVPEVFGLLTESRDEWADAIDAERTFLQSDARTRDGEISSRESLFWLLALLGALLLGTAIVIVGRSILGPLGRLIDHADTMTKEQLPDAVSQLRELGASDEVPEIPAIPRESDDEIGSLVDAFNSVQETAVQIATDQARSRRNVAEMFVNLGRRNQQLNQRMLHLISDLERDEQNPDVLDGLYRLDHIATRMRRNAESLLVLAGNRSPRQWSQPVSLEDVVRSSLAEVEVFDRVEIGDLPQMFLKGAVVADVTHLLAELLDNATQFSDPDKPVTISAHETLEGVEVEVFDEGVGIGEEDLDSLNARISNPPQLDEAPSRLLGLFVVGRLAEQHDVTVQLESKLGVGTAATVALPTAMIPDEVFELPGVRVEPVAEMTVEEELADLAQFGLDQPDDFAGVPAAETIENPSVDEAVDSWAPTALHEEVLAEASVPTMDEVIEAIPSFETTEEPEQWPLTRIVPLPEAPVEPSILIEAIDDVDEESALIAINEMYAPESGDSETDAGSGDGSAGVGTDASTEPPVEPPRSASLDLPAPPILAASSADTLSNSAQESAPELTPPPLPTRTPQAALAAVEAVEAVESNRAAPVGFADIAAIPEPDVAEPSVAGPENSEPERADQGDIEVAKSLPSPFASFADGVSRGLGEIADTPQPQFSNIVDPEELS